MTEEEAIEAIAARVSRETLEKLELYAAELETWQRSINLVARSTLSEKWARHFLDSLQLLDLVDQPKQWLDLGSGGGFPGLVCAIAAERIPGCRFTFVESDLRKCSFMREVARKTGTPVSILSRRIEDVPPQSADIISARALTSLDKLCELAHPHLAEGGTCLFLKGRSHQEETDSAMAAWRMDLERIPSKTDPEAVILRLRELERA